MPFDFTLESYFSKIAWGCMGVCALHVDVCMFISVIACKWFLVFVSVCVCAHMIMYSHTSELTCVHIYCHLSNDQAVCSHTEKQQGNIPHWEINIHLQIISQAPSLSFPSVYLSRPPSHPLFQQFVSLLESSIYFTQSLCWRYISKSCLATFCLVLHCVLTTLLIYGEQTAYISSCVCPFLVFVVVCLFGYEAGQQVSTVVNSICKHNTAGGERLKWGTSTLLGGLSKMWHTGGGWAKMWHAVAKGLSQRHRC